MAAPREEEEEEVPYTGGTAAVTTTGTGAVMNTGGAGIVNTAGAGAVTTGAGAVITTGAGAVITIVHAGFIINTTGGADSAGSGLRVTATRVSAPKGGDVEEEGNRLRALPWMVGILGGMSVGMAIFAALCRSPLPDGRRELVCRVAIASVIAAGVAKILAAFWFWFSLDTSACGAVWKKICLCASALTFLAAVVLLICVDYVLYKQC